MRPRDLGFGRPVAIFLLFANACGGKPAAGPPPEPPSAAPPPVAAEPAACPDPVPVFVDGVETRRVCAEEAGRAGLTVVDLSDDWVPLPLRAVDDHPYRATYVALANEELGDGPAWARARQDRFFELYGIPPSFRVVAARLLDEPRHACHAGVDPAPFAALHGSLNVFEAPRTAAQRAAVRALDARLVCEGLLPPAKSLPRPRWRVQDALEAYQRKHAIVRRGLLDAETRRILAEDPRELEYRALLRTLRARVVDATGLIEDGSARAEPGTVLGRRIQGDAFYAGTETPAGLLERGAPDLVSPATEAAARALGWTDPAAAAAWLRARPGATARLRVALALPPPPPYHGAHMELRAEIDRGDVWYELPQRRGRIERRPTLTLWARTADGGELALVRWRTTIGGWKKEVGRWGQVGLKYKNSDVGRRVWRDVVVTPAWVAPQKTPPRTMVRLGDDGRWEADTDLLAPGYASAYGLVMVVHHVPGKKRGQPVLLDNGIRTHGSVSYDSILTGESHGCHRLFNASAMQLASFLLGHRHHVRHGLDDRQVVRTFKWKGRQIRLRIPHRGARIELTPPVEVEVLKGTIRGRERQVPVRFVKVRKPRRAVVSTAE